MIRLFLSLTFLVPLIGLYSGLSAAVTVPLFTITCLLYLKNSLKFNLKDYKLEFIFLAWIFLSSFWAINPATSLLAGLKFTTEFLIGLILIKNIPQMNVAHLKVERTLLFALLTAFLLFYGEYLSCGTISLFFRKLAQAKVSHIFYLHYLDKGIALLTLSSWIAIGIFLKNENKLAAFLTYVILLSLLVFSDSLASLVAHLAGALVFFLTRFTILKNPKILCCILLISSVCMIVLALEINPLKISQENKILPISSKHRLFIWNFVAKASLTHPIFGVGFNSSRVFPVKDSQIIFFSNNKLHPLPLHPHNNILQVYFELGIIGLILYLCLAFKYLLIIGKNYQEASSKDKNILCTLYACASVYFVIALVSYNCWQGWWVQTGIWTSALASMLLKSPADLQVNYSGRN